MDKKEWPVRVLPKQGVERADFISPMRTEILSLMRASGWLWPDSHHAPRKMAETVLWAMGGEGE
jgi:hypothetical protein